MYKAKTRYKTKNKPKQTSINGSKCYKIVLFVMCLP